MNVIADTHDLQEHFAFPTYPLHLVILKQATLKVRGKALSAEQKVKVVSKTQTENPLYLKTLLEVSALFLCRLYP